MPIKKIALAALAVLAAAVVLAGTACKGKSAREAVAEKRLENMLEKASGGKVDLNLRDGTMKVKTAEGESVLTTGERKWPEDLPESAVKFEDGKIQAVSRAVTEDGKTWTIHFRDVGEKAMDDYSGKLKEGGWTIEATTSMGQGGMVQASKDDLMVNIIVNTEQKAGVVSFRQGREK